MLLDVLAWVIMLAAASVIGAGVLAAFGAYHLRIGDRVVLGAWLGVVVLSIVLLGVSIIAPLSPALACVTAAVLSGVSWWAISRNPVPESRRFGSQEVPLPAWGVVAGLACIALGTAMLASDPVTLYDSLVYHVGIMRWLREHGTVPGVALIHNRLGHVSAWFALGAPFDAGVASDRTANIPLGAALVLVAGQTALAIARLAARRAAGADAFLALASAMLIWAVVRYNAATPSPDVAANVLIVIVAWALLVVSHVTPVARTRRWHRWLTPRLIPFVLAVGAAAMKLFALPAAIAAALFYTFAPADDRGTGIAVRRAGVCVLVAAVVLLPFVAANVVASGCPLFPSPIACVPAAWSVGPDAAAAYADYIRDVARWEVRSTFKDTAGLSWVGPWVAAHPVVFVLVLLSPVLAALLLVGPRRGGVRSALLVAVLGIAFAAWQAPAPRFLYAFAIVAPALAVAFPLVAALQRLGAGPARGTLSWPRPVVGFMVASLGVGSAYAVASQKVNVRSALRGGGSVFAVAPDDVMLPASPERPSRLYRWRVNDVDVFTPVPRPVADTLGYTSRIDGGIGFEKCSTAPLPCTPYLPSRDVRLRSPARGLGGGFVRQASGPTLAAQGPVCLGELREPFRVPALTTEGTALATPRPGHCGETNGR